MSDRRWGLLEEACDPLLATFGSAGVTRIEYPAAFPDLDGFAVWLCTTTDDERETLGRDSPSLEQVRGVLLEAGFSPDELQGLATVAQSQETVDRDFESSWFYAMR